MFQIFMITYLLMYRKYKQHENVKDFSYLNSNIVIRRSLSPIGFYTPRNEVVGGVYWFHHVRPSVDKSYVVR
jgi:hypothetical protein